MSRIRPSFGRSGSGHSESRLQNDVGVGRARRHRVRREVGGTAAREHERNLRKLSDDPLVDQLHRLGLRKRRAGNPLHLHDDVLFVEPGDELLPEPGEQQRGADHRKHSGRDRRGAARTWGSTDPTSICFTSPAAARCCDSDARTRISGPRKVTYSGVIILRSK